MAIDPARFWASDYSPHPPLTDAMLARAEAELGVTLPAEFVRLLRVQNGGYTARFAFPTARPTTWAEDHVPLHDLFGIVTDPAVRTALNLLDTAYMTREWDLPPRQVLLSGEGHWWITLDYRGGGPSPSVAWLNVDAGQDFTLAPTFAAFLEALVPQAEFDEREG